MQSKNIFKNPRFWSLVVFIIILVFGTKSWYINRAIDPTKDVEIIYAGKNGHGYIKNLDQYYAKVTKNIDQAVARKDGIKPNDLKKIQQNQHLSTKLNKQAKLYRSQIKNVSIKISKTTNLKNEDQIQLTVKTTLPNMPIKNIDQTVTVSGLKN